MSSRAAASGAVAGLALSMLLASLGTSIANVGLPTLAASFDAPFQHVQWVVLAYLLASTTSIVGVGRLGDVAGRRRVLTFGLGLYVAASIACGLSATLWMLIVARGAQGVGAATMMALAIALVGEAVPTARIGFAMGLLGTTSAIGTALGPALGGLLIAGFGWRALFFATVPLGLLTLVLVGRCVPLDARRTASGRTAFDVTGTIILALTLAAYALSMTIGRGHVGAINVGLLVAAAIGVVAFVRVEASARAPLVQLAMFRDATLRAGLVMSVLVATVVMATLVVGPFYLSLGLGLDAARTGLVMTAGPAAAALAGVPAGRLVDRHGARHMTVIGLVGMAAGTSALALTKVEFGIAGYVAPIVFTTAAYALFQAANNTAVMSDVDPGRRGVVSGLLNLSRTLGLMTGASLMGAVFTIAAGTGNVASVSPQATATGMRVTFLVATLLVLTAIVVATSSGTVRRGALRPE